MFDNIEKMKELSDVGKARIFDAMVSHGDKCPLGWDNRGKLLTSRNTKDGDIVEWLKSFRAIMEGKEGVTSNRYLTMMTDYCVDNVFVYKVDDFEGTYILEIIGPIDLTKDGHPDVLGRTLINRKYVKYGRHHEIEFSHALNKDLKYRYHGQHFAGSVEIIVHADAERVIHNAEFEGPYVTLRHILKYDATGTYSREL